jgi:hypothetical protein
MERRYASLSFLAGDVKVQRSGDMNWTGGEPKMRLASGDRVRTFGGSRAEVLFDDGSVLKIKPDSLIIICDLTENVRTKVRKTQVRLMVSSIEADIKKSVVEGSQFKLVMPSATAEMGRASFSVDVGPGDDSKIRVYAGQVAVDTGASRVDVGENSQVSVGSGRDLSPVAQLLGASVITSPRNLDRVVVGDPSRAVVTLGWRAVPRASGYRLQVSGDRRFAEPSVDSRGIRSLEFRLAPAPAGVHFARVAAEDLLGQEGAWSEPVVFRVVVDRRPPEVAVVKFVSSRAAGGVDLFIEGSTEPTAEVSLAGRSLTVDAQGRFSATLRGVAVREREVVLTARDPAGNEQRVPLKVAGGA